ncbi:MAG: hypothetical protein SFY96_02590 [Planctomycetota bacterium]|nr:hypothetical protein [Planctomycetota bacterium]
MSTGSGAGMLTDAVNLLRREWHRSRESWRDEVALKFGEAYIEPLEPALRKTVQAMDTLQSITDEAVRACETR